MSSCGRALISGVMIRTALEKDLCALVWRVEQSKTRSRGTNYVTVSWRSGFALESLDQSVFERLVLGTWRLCEQSGSAADHS